MLKKYFVALLLMLSITLLASCETVLEDDFTAAKNAINNSNFILAEKLLDNFLQDNLEHEMRFDAYLLMVALLHEKRANSRLAAEYLEEMLSEFGSNSARLQLILQKLAKINEEMKNYGLAVEVLQQLVNVPNLSDTENLKAHRRMAHMQILMYNLSEAENNLLNSLSISASTYEDELEKISILYDLAYVYLLQDKLAESEMLAKQIIDDERTGDSLKVLTNFLMANALQLQDKFVEALELLRNIRDIYPNPNAIDERIKYLELKIKK